MGLVDTLIAAGVGASLGAFLSYVVGVRQALMLDGMRRKQDEKTAIVVIANELSRIINWHDKLLALKKEIDVFEVWGMFLPINSLASTECRVRRQETAYC